MADLRVGVLGAGVVGLTTALQLQREFRNARVTVVADRFDRDTTSDGAAGIFRPGTSFAGPDEQTTRKWICDAYEHWDQIRLTKEAAAAGVMPVSGYIFSSVNKDIVENAYIEKIVPIYRRATERELEICPGDWKYGSFFSTLLIECRNYQPWARDKFVAAGGRIVQQKIDHLQQLAGQFDVVVNCSGLGSRHLCHDYKLVPIRGQVLKVQAPWLKTFFYADYDTYVIPGTRAATLGGTRQYDSYNLDVCRHDTAAIRERCEALVPSLRDAPLLDEWVGLRPHRAVVRVERETLRCGRNAAPLKIVHNYGHGGYGVTTAPGTALHAVKLVREAYAANSKL